jgi:hypothetical protein
MSVGTGIFLGAVVVALVVLFINTSNRWNWKRISILGLGILIGLPVLAVCIIYGLQAWNSRPQTQDELWGVRLGDSEADVKFKKGTPTHLDSNGPPSTTWLYPYTEDGKLLPTLHNGDVAAVIYLVKFSPSHKVKFVICAQGDLPTFTHLSGITPTSSLEEIEAALGQPDYVSRLSDETERWYSFNRYHVAFAFKQEQMSEVAVFDPNEGPVRFAAEAK